MVKPDPRHAILGCVAVALAGGCTVYAASSAQATSTSAQAQGAPAEGQAASSGVRAQGGGDGAGGVTVVETRCGADELCNGLDDDCDGVIDEGCGYDTGAIQVTLGWSSGVDLDLYVIDPLGQTLSYDQSTTTSGGRLDQDARGNCGGSQSSPSTENAFWRAGSHPPSGRYRVEVHYWGDCNTGVDVTTANLSIAAAGRIIGAYAVQIGQGQRMPVASFTIE